MTRMKTRKACTRNVLESHFVKCFPNGKYALDTHYLNEMIRLYLDNKIELYNTIEKGRSRPEAIVWRAFQMVVDDYLNNEYQEPNTVFYASSQQLKEFLFKWGVYNYEALKRNVDYVKEVRRELKENAEI